MRTFLLIVVLVAASAVSAKPKAKSVSLDVKDADIREVLQSMKQQCGVKNLVIDPDVKGSGTFYFRKVPCETAFRIVTRTAGLTAVIEPNSVLMIQRQRR